MTDELSILRRLDPAPPGSVAGAARSAWGEATLARIVTGEIVAPSRRRWPALVTGAAGLATLVGLVAVLIIATGGNGDRAATAPPAELIARPAPGTPLNDATLNKTVVALVRRAGLLGIDGVDVFRNDDRFTISLPAGEEGRLGDLIAPGRLSVYSFDRSVVDPEGDSTRAAAEARSRLDDAVRLRPGGISTTRSVVVEAPVVRATGTTTLPVGSHYYVLRGAPALVGADVADARATEPSTVGVALTPRGEREFLALTRQAAQDGLVEQRLQVLAIVIDGELIANPAVDYNQYPAGIDGRNGFEIPAGPRDATLLAAQIATPLPLDLEREGATTP